MAKYDSASFKEWYPSRKLIACSALSQNSFAIGPEGKIYKCMVEIDQDKYSIGDLKNGICSNKRYISWLTADVQDKCLSCKLLPICQGGCHKTQLDKVKMKCGENIDSYKEKLFQIYEGISKKRIKSDNM